MADVTLTSALAKARFGRVGLALAVDADQETMPKKKAVATKLDTLSQVVLAFEESSRDFGGITAIGPLDYSELETDFSKANAFSDMPPTQAFTLLIATLDDKQRAALTGKAGLGMSDLTTPEQKQIFEALLPDEDVNLSSARRTGRGAGRRHWQSAPKGPFRASSRSAGNCDTGGR